MKASHAAITILVLILMTSTISKASAFSATIEIEIRKLAEEIASIHNTLIDKSLHNPENSDKIQSEIHHLLGKVKTDKMLALLSKIIPHKSKSDLMRRILDSYIGYSAYQYVPNSIEMRRSIVGTLFSFGPELHKEIISRMEMYNDKDSKNVYYYNYIALLCSKRSINRASVNYLIDLLDSTDEIQIVYKDFNNNKEIEIPWCTCQTRFIVAKSLLRLIDDKQDIGKCFNLRLKDMTSITDRYGNIPAMEIEKIKKWFSKNLDRIIGKSTSDSSGGQPPADSDGKTTHSDR